jgi:hypothetical protein
VTDQRKALKLVDHILVVVRNYNSHGLALQYVT